MPVIDGNPTVNINFDKNDVDLANASFTCAAPQAKDMENVQYSFTWFVGKNVHSQENITVQRMPNDPKVPGAIAKLHLSQLAPEQKLQAVRTNSAGSIYFIFTFLNPRTPIWGG